MKTTRLIMALALAFVGATASAQYVCTVKGTVLKHTETAEKESIETYNTITDVAVANGVTTVTFTHTEPGGDTPFGEIVTTSTASFASPDQPTTIVEMSAEGFKSFIMGMIKSQLEAAGQYNPQAMEEVDKIAKVKGELSLVLNPAAAAGEAIAPSKLTMDMGVQRMTMSYSNGAVVGFESVTVPAGTFEKCLKITIVQRAVMPGNTEKVFTTEWYAPGVGLVKEECADKKGKVLKTIELKEIVKP